MDLYSIAIAKALSGGGGGGGGASSFVVNFTLNEDGTTATADKTFAQLANAINQGQSVIGLFPFEDAPTMILHLVDIQEPTAEDDGYARLDCLMVSTTNGTIEGIVTSEIYWNCSSGGEELIEYIEASKWF